MKKKNSYSYEDLLACGHGELFGAGNAKLPLPPMLMFDRIVNITDDGGKYGHGRIVAELDVTADLWFFQCHFENDPVMPGCLGLDALWQMVGFFIGWRGTPGAGRALGVGSVKFTEQVNPSAKLISYIIDIKRVFKRKITLCIAAGIMKVDGVNAYAAEGLKVAVFTAGETAAEG